MQHVSQALLLKMALKFDFKFTERFYLSNLSRNGVVSSGAVYFEAPLILSTFAKGGHEAKLLSLCTCTRLFGCVVMIDSCFCPLKVL